MQKQIMFNGEAMEVDVQHNLADLLKLKQLTNRKGIAVAVNQQVVSKNNWEQCVLKDKDSVLIITATQGG